MLSEIDRLQFGNYGDWSQTLLDNAEHSLIWMIFLEDLISEENPSQSDLSELLEPLLDMLIHRLEHSSEPTLIAYSGWKGESAIYHGRSLSGWKQIVRAFSDSLYDLAERYSSLFLINMDEEWAVDGLSQAFDARNYYAARCRLSRQGLARLAATTASVLGRVKNAPKKVLVLDCDNTLWGGVIGEVGVAGIQLGGDGVGKAFSDFQTEVNSLIKQGVLVVLASKNNEDEVWDVFDKHPEMQLEREKIVSAKINWDEKPDNLYQIAEELGLGLDSFVFWDDNPIERGKMRASLPEVVIVEPPEEIILWPGILRSSDWFARFVVTDEDQQKTLQYRARSAFSDGRKRVADENDFLKSIKMVPRLHEVESSTLSRAEQLSQKTNQFNLRTKRYSASELDVLSKDEGCIAFLISLSDQFGDNGIVGLVVVKEFDGVAFLDTFLMSCRVMGRKLEQWMYSRIARCLMDRGIGQMLIEFRDSGRNVVVKDFLAILDLVETDCDTSLANEKMSQLAEGLGCTGDLFIADLTTLELPNLDLFCDEA